MTPDVNILVAVSRVDHDHHRAARTWLDRAVRGASGGDRLVLLPMVVSGYLRVTRSPAFPVRLTAAQALALVEDLLAHPGVVLAPVGAEWTQFADFYRTYAPTGGGVTDAWIAAAVLHLGEHLVTFDRGFRHLLPPDRLTVLDPTAS